MTTIYLFFKNNSDPVKLNFTQGVTIYPTYTYKDDAGLEIKLHLTDVTVKPAFNQVDAFYKED